MVVKMQNTGIGNEYAESRATETNNKKDNIKNGAVFGGNIKQKLDPVAAKKAQAQKKAMKMWGDAVAAEQKIDSDIEERLRHIDDLRTENAALHEEVKKYGALQEELRKDSGITDKEQADVDLLIKSDKAKQGEAVSFTEEELARLEELKEQPLEERLEVYKEKYGNLGEMKELYQKEIEENDDIIRGESNIIKGISNGRLKSHAMIDAQKAKDEMMIAASKEAAYMMMDEVKDKIDEDREEQEEKVEEKKAEEEEEQERLEAIKDKKEEDEEDDVEVELTEQFVDLGSSQTDVKQEVEKMVNEMKLLVEDLKGAKVNEIV